MLIRGLLLLVLGPAFAFLFLFRPFSCASPGSIPQGWGHGRVPDFVGRPATPRPIEGPPVPGHPFMAATGSNNMHVDSYVSDAHPQGGPLGRTPSVTSIARGFLGGECASVTFDRRGRIVTVCMSVSGGNLLLLDPRTLEELASFDLPPRPSTRSLNIRTIVTDTSGGAYFYLDHLDWKLRVVGIVESDGSVTFRQERNYDLAPDLERAGHAGDTVTTVLPDWEGRYWFVTRHGLVGTVDRESGTVAILPLPGEEIQNSFAVDSGGVYILSDHALYRFEASPTGAPRTVWRETYDRGTHRKPGMIHHGAGATPTLLGEEWVAITDNADPRMNVLVYRRGSQIQGDRLVCRHPVFEPGKSTTENTLIGYGRSIIVENNYGYDLFIYMMFGRTSARGVTRIDLDEAGTGCRTVWESDEISQTVVPKLSLANGLVYLYTKDPEAPWGVDAFYLTAVDFRTGETIFKVLTGTGVGYDNHWAPITLGPDGTAYAGTLRGLIAIRDGD
jgi:outer membrane protein assembly factor BamB